MHRLKNRGIVVLSILGLFAFSGIAMADDHEETEPAGDTVFNYGYDQENQFLIWNVSSLDYEPDTETMIEILAEDDPLNALMEACRLDMEDEEDGIAFDSYGYDAATDEITLYDGENPIEWPEACSEALNGGYVTGPNGQVNHGMFLKLFNELYDGPVNRGCLVRHIAQSDLGKPDSGQKVEAEPGYEATEPESIVGGTVDFTMVTADCIKGEKDNGNGKGKPPWAGQGKPDWSDGKPGNGNRP